MTAPHSHAPVIPEVTGKDLGQPLRCAVCGGVLHLVCGDAPASAGTPAMVDRAPDPARQPTPRPPSERKTAAARARWATGFTFKPKTCAVPGCGATFTPKGPRQRYCETHLTQPSRAKRRDTRG